jgi:ribosome maturation factor RimP
MAKKSRTTMLEELFQPVFVDDTIELVDVVFEKRGSEWFLTVYIDKPEGISLDDCEYISRKISDILDEADPIEQSYLFEVSSLGLDRPLKKREDFIRSIGKEIVINLYTKKYGDKEHIGMLDRVEDDNIVLIKDGEEFQFELKGIGAAKLFFQI